MKRVLFALLLLLSAPALAQRTINSLPAGTPAQNTDEIAIQRGTVGTFSYKLTVGDIRAAIPLANVTGFGTGVGAALAINVGSAGAPVLFNGALGTPSSGTVTNLTGTASININGTVGATTPAAGSFTTMTASSTATGLTFVPTGSSAPTNGMFLPAANTLGWGINSAEELRLTATALSPGADGGNSLGTTALGWQNLFSNTGFVWNIENGNWVATHTSGILTVGTGDLRVTTPGTNAASVATLNATQTFQSKTLGTSTAVTASISWGDGVKQTFNPDGTNAGINVGSQAGDPSGPANGDIWYNSSGNTLRARINGATVSLGAGGGSGCVPAGNSGEVLVDDGAGGCTATGVTISGNEITAANLLIAGTLTDTNFCSYTASGTLINCNTGFSGTGDLARVGAPTFTTSITTPIAIFTGSSVPANGVYLPAANTLGFAVNSAAEVQLTGTALSPAADGGNSLGTTALGWQNLFGNTGFVLNIENGNWVATHTSAILTVGTGDLRVTTAGTNSASVVTVGGNQTLTSKSLTAPTISDATVTGFLNIPNGTGPTTDAAGEIAFDTNAWTRGAMQVFDGTANTYVVATLASDTPSNGQVPTWKTGGTIEWETPSGGGSGCVPAGSNGQVLTDNGSGACTSNTTGTGVVTAIGNNTNASGGFHTIGGALGTPASGDTVNLTINVGNSDTTVTRSAAGVLAVEGVVSTRTIFQGTATINPGAITSGTCSSAITTSATGVVTTDTIDVTLNADPTSTTGYNPSGDLVYIWAYPTADNINLKVCNKSGNSVTPGSRTANIAVRR